MNTAVEPCPCRGSAAAGFRVVDGRWGLRDWLGTLRVRLGLGRSQYRVTPGLYALGAPDAEAPVFVTGNYKLSFDHLRRALAGRSAWILVVDTRGVNVWCAAAKGTFSAAEVATRLASAQLTHRVRHRRLVLPQLAAPGVNGDEVRRLTGFHVEFGPVRAADIPAWLAAGRRKTDAMRRVTFTLADRLTLAPVEITNALRSGLGAVTAIGLLAAIRGQPGGSAALAGAYAAEWLGTLLVAGLLVPALLPWLPSRSFAVKGATVGLSWAVALLALARGPAPAWLAGGFRGPFSAAGGALLVITYAAWMALNFTGATVFTSQSGTLLETRRALPAIVVLGAIGFGLQLTGAILQEAA